MSEPAILIVEDSLIVALHLRSILEKNKYEVLGVCESGELALKFVNEKRPDLVFMDITLLGQLDGIDTANLLKSDYDIPCVFISALTDPTTKQRIKEVQPLGHLPKPFEEKEIIGLLKSVTAKIFSSQRQH